MTTIRSVKDVKKSKPSTKVAVFAMLLLPIAGVACLIFPQYAEEVLPLLLGLPMVFSGIGSIVAAVRGKDTDEGRSTMGTSIMMLVLGFVIVVHGSNSTLFIGIIWGLLGLVKAAHEFDDIFQNIKDREPFVFSLVVCVFEVVLAVLLILNPYANIEHHLLLLGIQLIIYPFTLHREQGKLKIEAEA